MLLCSGHENGRFWQKRASAGGLRTIFYAGDTRRTGLLPPPKRLAAIPFHLEKRLT